MPAGKRVQFFLGWIRMAFPNAVAPDALEPGKRYILVSRTPMPGAGGAGRRIVYTGVFERYGEMPLADGRSKQTFFRELINADGSPSETRSTDRSHIYIPYSDRRLAELAGNPYHSMARRANTYRHSNFARALPPNIGSKIGSYLARTRRNRRSSRKRRATRRH